MKAALRMTPSPKISAALVIYLSAESRGTMAYLRRNGRPEVSTADLARLAGLEGSRALLAKLAGR